MPDDQIVLKISRQQALLLGILLDKEVYKHDGDHSEEAQKSYRDAFALRTVVNKATLDWWENITADWEKPDWDEITKEVS